VWLLLIRYEIALSRELWPVAGRDFVGLVDAVDGAALTDAEDVLR